MDGRDQVANLIANEHPQIIASILVHLERDQASEILGMLAERTRNDVVLRIATLDSIQPNALRELNDVLAKLLSGGEQVRRKPLGGIRTAAEMLNYMPTQIETSVLDAVKAHDGDLAQKILDEMFVFENLLEVDDRGIQALLREVQSEALIVALRGSNEALREKIFRMSQRASRSARRPRDEGPGAHAESGGAEAILRSPAQGKKHDAFAAFAGRVCLTRWRAHTSACKAGSRSLVAGGIAAAYPTAGTRWRSTRLPTRWPRVR